MVNECVLSMRTDGRVCCEGCDLLSLMLDKEGFLVEEINELGFDE